jgi:rSAM/selenodomain-associated transferase 2
MVAGVVISVVVPTYNEERALPATLARVLAQPGHYEVIIADGGSRDRTQAVASAHPNVRWLVAPKGRASQMNAGANDARGDWLLFLHADTLLPEDALAAIAALDGAVGAGGFRHRFSGSDPRLRAISWADNLRCRLTRVFYGDQALFVRRTLFERLGGFPEDHPLEDVVFCERLNRLTRPQLLDAYVVTDARKFLQMGVWKSLGRVAWILTCHELRLPIPAREFFKDVR